MKTAILVLFLILNLMSVSLMAGQGLSIHLENEEVRSIKSLKSYKQSYATKYGEVVLIIKSNSEKVYSIDLNLAEKTLLKLVEVKGKKIKKSSLYEVSDKNVIKYILREIRAKLNDHKYSDFLILDFFKDFDYDQDLYKDNKYVVALADTKIDKEVALALGDSDYYGIPFAMAGIKGNTANPNLTYQIGAGVAKGSILNLMNGKEGKTQFGFFIGFSYKF